MRTTGAIERCVRGIEFADGFDGVAEKFDADGALGFGGEDVDDAAADGELAGELDHFGAGVADGAEVEEEIVERSFDVAGEGAGEREVDVGILIAPEGGGDRGDRQGDLAVGEAEESGGAALEDVGVGALRLPGESVEGGEGCDSAECAGEDAGEEAESFGEGFGAFVGFGDEVGGAAEFVGDVGGDEGFGDVVQAGERDVIAAGAQCGERCVHRRMAQDAFEAFADGGEDHSMRVSNFLSERAALAPVMRFQLSLRLMAMRAFANLS